MSCLKTHPTTITKIIKTSQYEWYFATIWSWFCYYLYSRYNHCYIEVIDQSLDEILSSNGSNATFNTYFIVFTG